MSQPILSIRNLTKRFGGLTAVNKVSLDIDAGEVVALLGDNGAGKSTLIKCVSGVHLPEEGDILFEGRKRVFGKPIDARAAGIETIYQDLALADNLDVPANIFLGREIKHRYFGGLVKTLDDKQMLSEARAGLKTLDIEFPTLTRPIESLSGGQRQAVAIARAVYWKARLMIMDEPTNNLGVPEQRKVLELIGKLSEPGHAGDPHHPHHARRVRRRRPRHRHASRPESHRKDDRRHQRLRTRAIHGGRAQRLSGHRLTGDRPGRGNDGMVDLLVTGPARPVASLVLAHGAGAAMDSDWMNSMAEAFATRGLRVARFEFGYMAARRQGTRKPPPKAETLMGEYLAALDAFGAEAPVFIGGKSLGGRVASLVADEAFEAERIAGLVCLGYPFHPPGQPEKLRTAHLEGLKTPTLICQGTRDPFGTRDEVLNYPLTPAIELFWLEDGDHDFRPRKAISGLTLKDNLATAADRVAVFCAVQ